MVFLYCFWFSLYLISYIIGSIWGLSVLSVRTIKYPCCTLHQDSLLCVLDRKVNFPSIQNCFFQNYIWCAYLISPQFISRTIFFSSFLKIITYGVHLICKLTWGKLCFIFCDVTMKYIVIWSICMCIYLCLLLFWNIIGHFNFHIIMLGQIIFLSLSSLFFWKTFFMGSYVTVKLQNNTKSFFFLFPIGMSKEFLQ